MEKSVRLFIALIVIALGVVAWFILFPSPEKVIRSRLNALAKTASFEAAQGTISRAYYAQKIPDFFATNIVVSAEIPGQGTQTFEGRDSLLQISLAARQQLRSLKIEFVGIIVTLDSNKQTATVNLTAKITTSGHDSRDFTPQELNFYLQKEDGKWLIYRVETVKTLSQINRRNECHESLTF